MANIRPRIKDGKQRKKTSLEKGEKEIIKSFHVWAQVILNYILLFY